jgi:peptidoglycan-associated lipoprotein
MIMKNKVTFYTAVLGLLWLFCTSCNYTIKVKNGPTAYELKRYHDAIAFLQKEYPKAKSRSEKGKIAYKLADSYRNTGKNNASIQWYKTAYDNGYGSEALRGYAYALKQAERYKEALNAFKELGIEIGSPYEYRKEITACQVATDWNKQMPESGITVEPAPFNSPQNDFSPVWFPDGRIVFSSDRSAANGKETYRWTGNRYMDMFIVEPNQASAQLFDPGLNSPTHEGTPCFNASGKEVFFVRTVADEETTDQYCRLLVAQLDERNQWSGAEILGFQKPRLNYIHPCLSKDGNTLYFACNDPEGWGGYDLYATTRKPNSETGWSEPKLLSRNINTTANELFPAFEGDTLYFASNGHPGMGGLDIFKTYKLDKTNWAPPINLKSPINSGADDFGWITQPAPAANGAPLKSGDLIKSGFFTSNRPNENARGQDDIYAFSQRVPPPKPPQKVDTTTVVVQPQIIIEGYVVEKIFAIPDDPNSKMIGRRPISAANVLIENGDKPSNLKVNADGYFKIVAKSQTDYKFTGSKEGYLSNYTRFSTKGIGNDPKNPVQTFEVEIVLDKIYLNKEIVLENIYYDYDKWDIRPDAEPTLNKLAEVLQQNPQIKIQLGSHTDCRGNDNYNQGLSQKRAQSAVDYLLQKGIMPERLTALGYGEQSPAADCACNKCTEPEHQRNRRTTFKILE